MAVAGKNCRRGKRRKLSTVRRVEKPDPTYGSSALFPSRKYIIFRTKVLQRGGRLPFVRQTYATIRNRILPFFLHTEKRKIARQVAPIIAQFILISISNYHHLKNCLFISKDVVIYQ